MYLKLLQLHITVLDLVRRYNRLKRVYKLLSVAPLHAWSTQHHRRLLVNGRLRIKSCTFIALRLICCHRACLVGDREWHAVSDQRTCGSPMLRRLQGRSRAH